MKNLEFLVSIGFTQDKIVIPKNSTFFGTKISHGKILSFKKTKIYKFNRMGLKDLWDSGKMMFIFIKGGHIDVNPKIIKKYMMLLKDDCKFPIEIK